MGIHFLHFRRMRMNENTNNLGKAFPYLTQGAGRRGLTEDSGRRQAGEVYVKKIGRRIRMAFADCLLAAKMLILISKPLPT